VAKTCAISPRSCARNEARASKENARLEFGRDWFDRFLYTAPARSLTVISPDETAAEHRRVGGGCR
jgi:hypothetical protein